MSIQDKIKAKKEEILTLNKRIGELMLEIRDLKGIPQALSLDPEYALEKMCYTSRRIFEGVVYTISDQRYPEYNGREIVATLVAGKMVYSWQES